MACKCISEKVIISYIENYILHALHFWVCGFMFGEFLFGCNFLSLGMVKDDGF